MSGNRSIRIDGVTLTTGNTKMGRVLNISLPPPLTCSHTLPCYVKGCYAMRSAYNLYPKVRKAWDGNLQVWKEGFDIYRNAISIAIFKIKPELFRWHVGGDIPGTGREADLYVNAVVVEMARKYSDVRFWMTTKKHGVAARNLESIRGCKNLTVMLSMWPGLECNARTRRAWPTAWLDDPKNPDPRIPTDARHCSGRCDTCAACWGMKAGESVVFKKH